MNEINNIDINNNFKINKWNIHKKMISEIQQFKINGILTYKNGIKKIFLKFYLDNIKSENYSFIIYNFFGKKIFEFISNNNKLFLKNGKEIINLDNNKYLIEENYKILIKNLSSWIIGLPGDSKEFRINKIGRLKEIKHTYNSKKYIVKYHKYHNSTNPPLPINIEFNQGNDFINLRIKNWILS
ncbi:outer-membrane lipoprotein LolB [endosymbiont of Pachyrhynchus infernalis]|nr:outer-membrane lipoprotein LolB [endosymbiont of Pachyrhynchus infernalis]